MEPPLSGVNLQAKGLAGLPWEWHSLGKGLRSDGFHGNSTHVAQVYACATSCSLVDLHCISQQSSEHINFPSHLTLFVRKLCHAVVSSSIMGIPYHLSMGRCL